MSAVVAQLVRLATGVRAYRAEEATLPPGPKVYYANHRSHLDTLVIWAALPPEVRRRLRPVAAQDYWQRSAVHRAVARAMNCVLIPRDPKKSGLSPIGAMEAVLAAGDSLLIFPEGSRKAGEGAAFRSGLYHLCRARPELPCVPLYLQNVSRILPAGEFLPLPLIASLIAGAPMTLQVDESREAFLARARAHLYQLAP